MPSKKKSRKNSAGRDALVGALLGGGFMLLVVLLLDSETIQKLIPRTPELNAWTIFALFVAPVMAIFLHELGHWTAGAVRHAKTV